MVVVRPGLNNKAADRDEMSQSMYDNYLKFISQKAKKVKSEYLSTCMCIYPRFKSPKKHKLENPVDHVNLEARKTKKMQKRAENEKCCSQSG